MRRFVALCCVGWCLQMLVTTASAEPRIACDEPEHNFGVVSDVTEIRHTFVLKNVGDAPLNIVRVRPTCGCTTAGLANNQIPPGGTADVTTTLSLQGRRGMQHKPIYVESDDPTTPQFRLALVGTIEHQVEYNPQQVMLQVSPSQPAASVDVQFAFRTTEPHTVTGIETNAAFCQVELVERRAGFEYTLVVKTLPDLNPSGSYTAGTIAVLTDHPAQSRITIPVVLHQMRDVIVAPAQVTFSARLPQGTPHTQQILVRNRTPGPMAILEVIAPSNGVTVTTHPLSEGMHRLEAVFLNPPADLHGQTITVRVQREGAAEERYDVPIVMTTP